MRSCSTTTHRAETRREHLIELQQHLHLRSFRLSGWRACLQIGTNAAWASDRGEPIVQAMLAHLRTEGVLIPTAAGAGADWSCRTGART
jgi:hypothetical protein